MKKLFTLALAMLASVGLWAVDPDVSISNFTENDTTQYLKLYSGNNGATVAIHQNNPNALTGWQKESGESAYYFKCEASQGIAAGPAGIRISASFKIDSISLLLTANSANKEVVVGAIGWEADETTFSNIATDYAGTFPAVTASSKKIGDAKWTTLDLSKKELTTVAIAKQFKNVVVGTASKADFPSTGAQSFFLYGIKVWVAPSCTEPENALVLTSDANATVYVGDKITLSTTGGIPGAGIGIAGTAAETLGGLTGTTWTATAGKHTFVATQVAYNGYCAQVAELVFNVSEANPVTEVTVSGPTAAYIGNKVTLTASADVAADTIWWTDQYGQKQDSKDGVFSFTPDAAGEYTYTAWAENQFNDNPVTKAHTVTVTKLCGELIKVTQTGQSSATVTGTLTGTADVKLSSGTSTYPEQDGLTGRKIGSDNYWLGVKELSGTLQAADTVIVFCTTASANLILYSDKGATKVGEMIGGVQQGANKIALNANANGKNALYLYRVPAATDEKAGGNMNPFVAYISVTRSCEESSDATIAQLTVNGNEVAEEDGAFNYTVGASEDLATVSVAYVLNHPLATVKYDLPNPIVMTVPAAGTSVGQAITVIAEDGTEKTYTVNISKAAAASDNANLTALSVTGYTLDPVFAADVIAYTITKAYGAENPAVSAVTATPEDNNANAVVELAGDVFTITVTAEDNTTTKEYTITVNEAEAPKSLSSVHFANGCEAFIDNTNHTVKAFYLAETAAPEADAIVAGAGVAGALSEGKITVTGEDASTVDYIVTLEEVTPNTNAVASTADAGAFDGNEAWVKNGLLISGNAAGFSAGSYVLRRQLKSGDKADDQRVIAGWVRTYIFVGNASKLELANTTQNKKVKYAVDGGAYTETEANPIEIALEEGNHMIEIVTNQSGGDCNLSAPKLIERTATALDNAADAVKAVKRIENGQLFIEKNGVIYNAQGARLQ